jgi:hypothetical protein
MYLLLMAFFVPVSSLTVSDVFFPDAATGSTFVFLIYYRDPIPKSSLFVLSLAVLRVYFFDRLTDSTFLYSVYQGELHPQIFSLVLSLIFSKLTFSDEPPYRIFADLSCHKRIEPLHLPIAPLPHCSDMAPSPRRPFHLTIVVISSSMDRQHSDDMFYIAGILVSVAWRRIFA